jgi:hypothetical protein
METPTPDAPDDNEAVELVRGLVDEVQRDLDRADQEDDESRLETLEKTRRDLETELDGSLENGSAGH